MAFGVYADPNQLGQEVEQQYVMGQQALDPKLAIMAQKAQNSAYNPYYQQALRANNPTPRYDLSNSGSWHEGLAKGIGNAVSGVTYGLNKREDKQNLMAWQQQLQANQAAQEQAILLKQQQDAEKHAANREYIRQNLGGDKAAFAYDLNPDKFSVKLGESYGGLPTVKTEAHDKAFGSGLGKSEADIQTIRDQNTYLEEQGVNQLTANTMQLAPSAVNLIRRVTGVEPVDALSNRNRQLQVGQAEQQLIGSTVENQFKPDIMSTDLTGKTLNNQGQAIANQLKQIELDFEPRVKELEAQGASISNTAKAQELTDKQAALGLIKQVTEQMAQGKTLSPQEASRLDQVLKASGVNSNFLGDIKSIANPKSGTVLKVSPSKDGWVNLPSGNQLNTKTGETRSGNQSKQPQKPKQGSTFGIQKFLPNPSGYNLLQGQ